jgi:hypothetical protein
MLKARNQGGNEVSRIHGAVKGSVPVLGSTDEGEGPDDKNPVEHEPMGRRRGALKGRVPNSMAMRRTAAQTRGSLLPDFMREAQQTAGYKATKQKAAVPKSDILKQPLIFLVFSHFFNNSLDIRLLNMVCLYQIFFSFSLPSPFPPPLILTRRRLF